MVRYQDSPWHIRYWRCRWYLLVPAQALYYKIQSTLDPYPGDEGPLEFGLCWALAISEAEGKMEYFWTWDEVKARLETRLKAEGKSDEEA